MGTLQANVWVKPRPRVPSVIDLKGMDTNQCLSQTKTLLVKVFIEDVEEDDDLEVIVH